MKKFLSFALIFVAIIAAFCELAAPRIIETVAKEQIVNSTSATAVDVSLSSSPNFRIVLGDIDKVHATAAAGHIGEVDFKNLTLDAEKIRLDVMNLLFPNKNLSPQEINRQILKHADKIELRGIITEEEIKNFVSKKDDNFKDAQISLKPEGASATAKAKFFGRTVDLDVAGNFIVNNGDVYFHMTRLNTNSILNRVNIDSFMTDIKVLDSANLPLGLKFESVELREGEAVVTAISTVK